MRELKASSAMALPLPVHARHRSGPCKRLSVNWNMYQCGTGNDVCPFAVLVTAGLLVERRHDARSLKRHSHSETDNEGISCALVYIAH